MPPRFRRTVHGRYHNTVSCCRIRCLIHTAALYPITRNSFHFPLRKRIQKNTARIIQSRHIASAMPVTPRSRQIPNSTENTTLQPIVEKMLTYIVYLTSPAARSPFASAPEKG